MTAKIAVLLGLVLVTGCLGSIPGPLGSPSLDDVSYPPGLTESDADAESLATAHEQALDNRSFTIKTTEMVRRNGTLQHHTTRTMAVDDGWDRLSLTNTRQSGTVKTVSYVTEDGQFVQHDGPEGQRYDAERVTLKTVSSLAEFGILAMEVEHYVGVATYSPTDVRRVNGTTVIVLSAGLDDATSPEVSNYTSFFGTVMVDQEGIVRSIDINASVDFSAHGTLEFAFTMDLWNVDQTSVPEPKWVETAREEAS